MEWNISTTRLATLASLTLLLADMIRRFIQDRIKRKGYSLPPGPTPLPLLGSVLSINMQEPFRTYTEWRAKYGDIMYIRLLGMDVVVLNSPLVATELLEKRSQIYSDRPYIATVEPFGHDSDFAFAQYGEHWRLCRRIFHQTFSSDAAIAFHPMQLRKARQLILNMMDDSGDYASHYKTFTSAVTMCSVYDYDPSPRGDQMVSIINNFLEASMPALMPEKAVLLQVFPFLLHIPDYLPWSSIKHEARVAREWGVKMVEAPYQYVLNRIESKEDVNRSMVSDHIARMEKFHGVYHSKYEKALKQTSSTAFLGSVETVCRSFEGWTNHLQYYQTSALLLSFTLAMVKNPRIWKRAQADIDALIGVDRLPEFDDRSSLPYVDAILRETMRWQPPAPLGAPHASTKSDVYNGFYIPKGATVFGNIWAMSRDEMRYPEPEKFIPERFLDAEGMLIDDAPDFVFGFGRRICPGRHTANASLWIAMVTMLATLNFDFAKDAEGRVIEFEAKYMNGMARHPLTFPCHITPRPCVNRASLEQALAK